MEAASVKELRPKAINVRMESLLLTTTGVICPGTALGSDVRRYARKEIATKTRGSAHAVLAVAALS